MIRRNTNYLVLLKLQGSRDINSIMRECALGLTKEQLVAMYEYATDTKMSPLIVDFNEEPDKRFRKGFLEIINANNFLQAVGPRPRQPAYAHHHQNDDSEEEDSD
jgi:hypothetical protein